MHISIVASALTALLLSLTVVNATPVARAAQAEVIVRRNSGDGSDAQEALDTHNNFRALHGADPLTWDDDLASYAASYASSCVFEHTGGPYGENIATGYSSINASITAWYDEGADYDYNNGGFSSSTGHFTQVVWEGSSQLGCAWVDCETNETPGHFLMCEYNAPGNVIGYFDQNVLPPISKKA